MITPRSSSRVLLSLAVAVLGTPFSPGSFAGEVANPTTHHGVPAYREAEGDSVAKPSGFEFSGSVNSQTLNTYLYRGFLTEENSLIVQAWLDLHAKFPLEGVVESIDVHGQFWNSFSDGITGTGGPNDSPKAWAEADWTLGVTASFGGGFSLDVSYQQLRAPNGSFDDLNEASLTLAYDDSGRYADGPGLFRGWRPSINLVVETLGQEDLSGKSGTYLGVGIAPTFAAWHGEGAPTIAVPILSGWSLGSYYEDSAGVDHSFGFLDIGVDLTAPLGDSGWTIKFCAHGVYLGDTPTEYAGNRDLFVVLSACLTFAF